jgi:ABC-type transport system involved in multi-copper enzyme maturation permease subunit
MNSKALIIAKYTMKEALKSRILLVTLIVGVALMLVTYVATEFTYGVPEKVALDFGLGMLSLSSLGISLFLGATALSNEIDSRTIYMVISRPVSRWKFITGKILGLLGVVAINVMILSIMTLICSHLLGGKLDRMIFYVIGFNLLESILVLLLVMFFSLAANNIIASIMAFTLLVLGHAVSDTQNLAFVVNRPFVKMILEFYHLVLPAFYKLNLKDFVIYNHNLEASYLIQALVYGISYSVFLFFIILFIFNRKNLD